MAAPMNPMNQALVDAVNRGNDLEQQLQQAREDRIGWRWVRFGRGHHDLAGIIFAILGIVVVFCIIFAKLGPKVGVLSIGAGAALLALYLLGSWALDRRNHEGQQP